MVYQVERIVKDVRVMLDENDRHREMLSYMDEETLLLDERIAALIEEGARRVTEAAPLLELAGTDVPLEEGMFEWTRGKGRGASGEWEGGWMRLPEDFLRLYVIKMAGWTRPVSGDEVRPLPNVGSGAGFRMAVGSRDKPRVTVREKMGGRVLEWYGRSLPEMDEGSYIRKPRIDRDGGIEIAEGVFRDVVRWIAAAIAPSAGGDKTKH